MRLSGYGPRQRSERKMIVLWRDTCRSCGISLISAIGTLLSCFTFRKVDLVPTVEEYTILFRCPKIQADKAYSRAVNVPAFLKKLMSITMISEQWVEAWIEQ
ncbi:hypothetical protein Goshw_002118, partial [Gossypium schwendimanii]|nr:hypothetical protein [Gossypium schwendimanii]